MSSATQPTPIDHKIIASHRLPKEHLELQAKDNGLGFVVLLDEEGRLAGLWPNSESRVQVFDSAEASHPFRLIHELETSNKEFALLLNAAKQPQAVKCVKDLKDEHRTPLSAPDVSGNEWLYIKECLDTGWVSSAGRFVNRFEQDVADIVKTKFAVATSTGTAALHLALLVAGVEAGDEVLLPTLTFIATGNAVRYLNAYPTFIDIDPEHWQMDVDRLKHFLEHSTTRKSEKLINLHTGRPIKALLPVHLLGHPSAMTEILELAQQFELAVVEDNAEALGSSYQGQSTGSFGKIAALSFNGNKILTTGGGGVVVTNDRELADRVRYLSTQARDDSLEYIHSSVGYNYRLTNIAAAMGVAQLERLGECLAKKRRIAQIYREELSDLIKFQREATWARSNFWLNAGTLRTERVSLPARELMSRLRSVDIECRPIFHPLHSLPPFADCFHENPTVSEEIYQKAICLPSSVGLSEQRQLEVIDFIREITA